MVTVSVNTYQDAELLKNCLASIRERPTGSERPKERGEAPDDGFWPSFCQGAALRAY